MTVDSVLNPVFIGANVEELEKLAGLMKRASELAESLGGSLTNMINELKFFGRFGEEFAALIASVTTPLIKRIVAALAKVGDDLRIAAQKQKQVSDGTGKPTPAGVDKTAEKPASNPTPGLQAKPTIGDKYPAGVKETTASGPQGAKIAYGSDQYKDLVRSDNPDIIFKDEEATQHPTHAGTDHMMTPQLKEKLDTLAAKVKQEWPGHKLRVTEAYDADNEHHAGSNHYAGRAADITIDDRDPKKLARLYQLAAESGFDWVYYEDSAHVHASVKPEQGEVVAPAPDRAQ